MTATVAASEPTRSIPEPPQAPEPYLGMQSGDIHAKRWPRPPSSHLRKEREITQLESAHSCQLQP
jgi:hypothetical protein